jgi:tetratricopeptide (TPR) repeat protein
MLKKLFRERKLVEKSGDKGQQSDQKEKISTASKIPGIWEAHYGDKGPSPSHLWKIKRRATELQFLDVDRWSLREKKDPQEKYYDIHLDANSIKWKYSREKPKAWQASVELHLINKNTLKGTFEDTDGIADYEMRRMSKSNDYGRKEVEDMVPNFVRSDGYNKRGRDLDNAGKIDEAIREYTKAIQLTNNTLAYYNRACLYKDQRKFKEAIEDFRSYLKYGQATTPQGYSCQAAIKELEKKLKPASQPKGEKSNVLCPTCKCNLFIAEKDVDGVEGILKLECPECGQTTVKL